MKKAFLLLLGLLCVFALVGCNTDTDEHSQNNAKPAYIIAKVTETYETGCLVEVTDEGNYGSLAVGTPVHVSTNIKNCPEYSVGDYLKITFDGTVAESYPPQILHVLVIENLLNN